MKVLINAVSSFREKEIIKDFDSIDDAIKFAQLPSTAQEVCDFANIFGMTYDLQTFSSIRFILKVYDERHICYTNAGRAPEVKYEITFYDSFVE